MIYTEGTATFERFAKILDISYLPLNNAGYDLAELEGIHFPDSQHPGETIVITALFNHNTMPTLTCYFENGNFTFKGI